MAELPTQRDFEDFSAWPGRDVVDTDGNRIGAVELIFLDEATGAPEWVLVTLEDGEAFAPLAGAMVGERSIRVEQRAARVADAPRVDHGETLSVADEQRLYEHYGLEYSRDESETVLPEGARVERPRLKKFIGAPVPEPSPTAKEEPTVAEPPDMSPRNLSSATPSEIPPARPQAMPPEGGFTYEKAVEERRSTLRIASAIAAGALAGLIGVLVFRRARR
jgi:hypothetical protein